MRLQWMNVHTAVGAVCAAIALAAFGGAMPAHALTDQTCTLSEVVTYDPPLTNTARTVTFTVSGQLFNCTNPAARTGSYTESGTAVNATCTGVLSSGSGTRVFRWNDPALAPSSFSYNRTTSRVGGNIVVVAVGSISSGTFAGSPAKSTGIGAQPDPTACAGTGVGQLTAAGALSIGL